MSARKLRACLKKSRESHRTKKQSYESKDIARVHRCRTISNSQWLRPDWRDGEKLSDTPENANALF